MQSLKCFTWLILQLSNKVADVNWLLFPLLPHTRQQREQQVKASDVGRRLILAVEPRRCDLLVFSEAGQTVLAEASAAAAADELPAVARELLQRPMAPPELEQPMSTEEPAMPSADRLRYRRWLARAGQELLTVGLASVASLSPDFTEVALVSAEGVQLRVASSVGEWPDYRVVDSELPIAFDGATGDSADGGGGLRRLFDRFAETSRSLLPHWELLEQLDSLLVVLEPRLAPAGSRQQLQRRRFLHRRVLLGDRTSSLLIKLDPDASPAALPSVSAAGPLAEAVEAAAATNAVVWNARAIGAAGFLANLTALLASSASLAEPSATDAAAADADAVVGEIGTDNAEDTDCGICYADCGDVGGLESGDCIACERCRRRYHRSCAVEWLRGLPDTRRGFNRLHGCCPYCQARLCVLQDSRD